MPCTARTARPLVPTGLSPVTGTVRRVDRTNDPVGDDPSGDTTDAGSRGTTERLLNGLNDAQRHAVTLDATHLRILAGAGSGKTRVLTHRIAYRAEQLTLDPQRTLAVTFTRKAAGELRDRLGRLLSGTTGLILGMVWALLVAGAVILRLRTVLQRALVEGALEAAAREGSSKWSSGPDDFCAECEMPLLVDAMFCVNCGASVRARSKDARHAHASAAPQGAGDAAGSAGADSEGGAA